MILLPAVKFKSQQHPVVRFCRHLRLWPKPSLDDAEMTAALIGRLFWIAFAIVLVFTTPSLKWFIAICGCVDLLGRALGMKPTFYFIPIWIPALLGNFLFGDLSFDGREDHRITFNAPPPDKIKEVSAQLYNRPDGGPDIESFKLAPKRLS